MSQRGDFLASEPRNTAPDPAGTRTLALDFAGDVYRFVDLSDSQHAVVAERFGALLTTGEHQDRKTILTRVQTAPPKVFIDKPTRGYDYQISLTHGHQAMHAAGLQFAADIERDSLNATLYTSHDGAHFIGPFENLFRILAAYRLFEREAFVMHSAAFARNGRGFLCFGRSGAGKTTLCELASSAGYDIISDELNAIVPGKNGRARLLPMPFAGDFGHVGMAPIAADLCGFFALEQGTHTARSTLSSSRAASRMIASCPYLNVDPKLQDELFDRTLTFVTQQNLELLTFTKTVDFCKVIDEPRPQPVLHA